MLPWVVVALLGLGGDKGDVDCKTGCWFVGERGGSIVKKVEVACGGCIIVVVGRWLMWLGLDGNEEPSGC